MDAVGSKATVAFWKWLAFALLTFVVVDMLGHHLSDVAPASYADSARSSDDGPGAGRDAAPWGARSVDVASALDLRGGSFLVEAGSASDDAGVQASARKLGGGGDAGSHHGYEAMYFLVLCICFGAGVAGLVMKFPWVQQTVCLFILGWLFSLLMQKADQKLGGVGNSYNMWMIIDPHLLLFTMLPPLLAEEAISIDMHVAAGVAKQCIYLAGPGMVSVACVTALILWGYLPHGWDFKLCLSVGAILCATDPVAVVSLLKELGASPTLTMQIQGESLLNDGSAMVLFTVAYQMLSGESWDFGDVCVFIVRNILFSWIFGMCVGAVFWGWIHLVKNRFDHNVPMLQVSLTVLCAYCSFGVAEGIFHINGVLATVASSLFLARFVWPEVVSATTMHTVWEMFGFLGNNVVFFLAGALTANAMLSENIGPRDYLDLLVIYVIVSVVRMGLIFGSRPLLKLLSEGRKTSVSWQQALLISHAGLRGAVGLALAIHVNVDRAGDKNGNPGISEADADRVLFYVGGIALLTMVINATTSPMLVRHLKLSTTPAAQRRLMHLLHRQLENMAAEERYSEPVRKSVDEMLRSINKGLRKKGLANRASTPLERGSVPQGAQATSRCEYVERFLDDLLSAKSSLDNRISQEALERTARLLNVSFSDDDDVERMRGRQFEQFDEEIARGINQAFLHLVEKHYWEQMEKSFISPEEFQKLRDSVVKALNNLDKRSSKAHISLREGGTETQTDDVAEYGLGDFQVLFHDIHFSEDVNQAKKNKRLPSYVEKSFGVLSSDEADKFSRIHPIVDSVSFSVIVWVLLAANAILIFIEEFGSDSILGEVWFALDIFFTVCYTLEFAVKFYDERTAYFYSSWNSFDFSLVLIGWIGVVVNSVYLQKGDSVESSQSQMGRFVRITRALRLLRFFRMLQLTQKLRAMLAGKSMEQVDFIEEHMQKLTLLTAFARAHSSAQKRLIEYVGRREDPKASYFDMVVGQDWEAPAEAARPEVACCVLQSRVHICQARQLAALVCDSLMSYGEEGNETWLLDEEQACFQKMEEARKLEEFVAKAARLGAITSAEAEKLITPIHHWLATWAARADKVRHGYADRDGSKSQFCEVEPMSTLNTESGSLAAQTSTPMRDGIITFEAAAIQSPQEGQVAPPPSSAGRQVVAHAQSSNLWPAAARQSTHMFEEIQVAQDIQVRASGTE